MAPEMSPESRIAALEAEVARLRKTEEVREGTRQLSLTVQKARKASGDVSASTLSSACTSVCFSSVSTIDVNVNEGIVAEDPELASAFSILHKRAVEVLGEQGAVDAVIEESKKHTVIQLGRDGQ